MDMKRKLEVMKEIEEANRRHYEEWKAQQPVPPSPNRKKRIKQLDRVSWMLVSIGGLFVVVAALGYGGLGFVLHGMAVMLGGIGLQLVADLL